MDIDELPPAGELWWTAATLAARDKAVGADAWHFDEQHRVVRYDGSDGQRLRLQRLFGGRLVLWGIDPSEAAQPDWTGIPGWATSDAVHEWFERLGATFVAWASRDGWDTATPDAALGPLAPLLAAHATGTRSTNADHVVLERLIGADGDLQVALGVLEAARKEATTRQGQVRRILADEIRAQMTRTAERDRVLPQRPVVIVRWSRVASPPAGFAFSVHLRDGTLVEDATNHRLAEQFRTSLLNIFELLHHEEGDPASGGWLFARITYDGVNVHFERAFDSCPHWYAGETPTLETLSAEMARRDTAWRPAWARLL